MAGSRSDQIPLHAVHVSVEAKTARQLQPAQTTQRLHVILAIRDTDESQ